MRSSPPLTALTTLKFCGVFLSLPYLRTDASRIRLLVIYFTQNKMAGGLLASRHSLSLVETGKRVGLEISAGRLDHALAHQGALYVAPDTRVGILHGYQ